MVHARFKLSIVAAVTLTGCVAINRDPLPDVSVATDSQLQDFVGVYRSVDDDRTAQPVQSKHRNLQIEVQLTDKNLSVLRRWSDTPVPHITRIDLHARSTRFRDGRLRYDPKRLQGAPIFPGFLFSGDSNELHLDAYRNLVMIRSSAEGGLLLFCIPFYESRRSVSRFERVID